MSFSRNAASYFPVLGQWNRILLAIGIAVVSNSSNYLILYMPTFAVTQLSLPASSGFIATLLGGVILTVGSPVIGHWSDLVGRTRIMLVAAGLFLISAYPAFLLVTRYAALSILVAMVCWLSLVKTSYSGVLPSLMAEIFPWHSAELQHFGTDLRRICSTNIHLANPNLRQ
jgi:MHS family proline/betaine transporter-like MFS transporter